MREIPPVLSFEFPDDSFAKGQGRLLWYSLPRCHGNGQGIIARMSSKERSGVCGFSNEKKAEKKKKEKISFFSSLDCRKVIISKNPTQKGESWGALHIDEQKNRRFFFNPLDKEEKIK